MKDLGEPEVLRMKGPFYLCPCSRLRKESHVPSRYISPSTPFWIVVAAAAVLAVLAWTGTLNGSSPKTTTVTVTHTVTVTTTSSASPALHLRLTLIGDHVCNEKTKRTFRYRLGGNLKPFSRVVLHVFHKDGRLYGFVASNVPDGSPGLIQLDQFGSFISKPWTCYRTESPPTPPDQLGAYYMYVTYGKTGITEPVFFADVASKG